jgi:hypothetical protein
MVHREATRTDGEQIPQDSEGMETYERGSPLQGSTETWNVSGYGFQTWGDVTGWGTVRRLIPLLGGNWSRSQLLKPAPLDSRWHFEHLAVTLENYKWDR